MNWMMLLMALVQQAGPNLVKILPDLKLIAEALGRILVVIKGTTTPTRALTAHQATPQFEKAALEAGASQEDVNQILDKFAAATDHLPFAPSSDNGPGVVSKGNTATA